MVLFYSLNVSLVRSRWESAHMRFNLSSVYYDMLLLWGEGVEGGIFRKKGGGGEKRKKGSWHIFLHYVLW